MLYLRFCCPISLSPYEEVVLSSLKFLVNCLQIFFFFSFGSKLRSTKLGIIYNNELLDFSEFWPGVYKLQKDKKIPGKRPMSKASPMIFINQNGTVKGVFGAAGGHFIPTALSMVSLDLHLNTLC